jgi:putative tryptophan/tyrosine transport system substrate-binding protein
LRVLISLIFALMVAIPSLAQAYDVLVVMSRRDPALEEVMNGFRSARRFSERVLIISDYAEVDLTRIVRDEHPALVLTLGDRALAEAAKLKKTPVVALMSLNVRSAPNVTGINPFAGAREYMAICKGMKAKRVGVLYDPVKSGQYLEQAQQAARKAGIELVLREVHAPQETPGQLASLKGKIDALWMWPDTTAVTRLSVEAYATFSLEQHLPLISFSGEYLKLGAAAVQAIDYSELGRQANALVTRILEGTAPVELPIASPRRSILKTNIAVLKHLGLDINVTDGAARRDQP